jgi:hypothetical protein
MESLSDDGKSPPNGSCKLAARGRRSTGSHLGHNQLGERQINNEVKAYSSSRLIKSNLIPRIYLTDRSNMSDDLGLKNLS